MKAVFVQAKMFSGDARRIGITDEHLQQLEKNIMENPAKAPVMSGTGGVRKIRLPLSGGKSGGGRACYVWFAQDSIVYLVAAFAKNEKSNLTQAERNDMQKLVRGIGRYLEDRRSTSG